MLICSNREKARKGKILNDPRLWGVVRKEERNPKLKYTIYFICLFMPNVNMLIVVKVLECIHASTVERRLPQLRGWGVVVARGTPPAPTERQHAPIPQSPPRTLLSKWARHPNTTLN